MAAFLAFLKHAASQGLWEFHLLNAFCMVGFVKSARHPSCSTGPSTMHFMSERFTISVAEISI